MSGIINASLQVLPISGTKHPYEIVNQVITVIKKSGLMYKLCPFETVVESTYNEVMSVFKAAQTCYNY
ncbi:MAG: hypothetical protein GX361_04970 [Bacteroidales bacterium]|nr:hypothetical protein [Bacteroidales bacterium]